MSKEISIGVLITPEDFELNAGDFNRKMVKLAQDMHIVFMDRAIKLYKENKEDINLDSLPKSALPMWQ